MGLTAEEFRLEEARDKRIGRRDWGPYLSERRWGTVREDYSDSGDAWDYFTHDQARSRAYRWGEDTPTHSRSKQYYVYLDLPAWGRHLFRVTADGPVSAEGG